MIDFFNTVFYGPLYNALFFIVSIIPGADIGIAIIILTLLVKFILFPLAHKSTKTQAHLKTLEPEIKNLKEKHKKDKQEQARKVMELYRKHGVNPFSGCLTVIIQLPVIIALYLVFRKGLNITDTDMIDKTIQAAGYLKTSILNQDMLYSFVNMPELIKIKFLGLIDMTQKSILIALVAGISQYFQIKLSMPGGGEKLSLSGTGSLKDDLAQSMKFQMRYILPVFVFIFAYTISAAVALYWATSNIFTIAHEIIVKKKAESLFKE